MHMKMVLLVIFSVGITYSLKQSLQRSEPLKKGFYGKRYLFGACLVAIGMFLNGLNAIFNLMWEKPILRVKLTGKTKLQQMEWKSPQGLLINALIPTYEVILETLDEDKRVFEGFLPGDFCAIRAKIFRFHPLLNTLGITNKYCLDLIYSGYSTAEKYVQLPVIAYPLDSPSPISMWIFKYWNLFFNRNWSSFWIRCAALESNYFPLIDEKGTAFIGEMALSFSAGLSTIGQQKEK